MITAATRNIIIHDIKSTPERLKHLNGETWEEMLGTFREYARRDAADGRIIYTRVQQRRLIYIMD